MTAQTVEKIKTLLTEKFQPTELVVHDDSARHMGHDHGGGGHYRVEIASQHFEGKTRVQQHQMVYGALGDMMQSAIHALVINIK